MLRIEVSILISLLSLAGIIWLRTRDRVVPPSPMGVSKAAGLCALAILLGASGLMMQPAQVSVCLAIILTGLVFFMLARYIRDRIPPTH
jgi:ABC-type enterochelin transport system permease subunit